MLEDLGIAAALKARRESFAKRHPALSRRILGQPPVFEPVKTTAIVVDLKTGDKIVQSGDKPDTTKALDQFIADRIDAAFSNDRFAREIDRKVSARIQAEVDAIVAKRVEAERREFERVNPALNRVSLPVIFETAVAVTGIDRDMLASPRRARHLAWPRQFAMWLVKELRPDLSLMAIGAAFSRDHTTVMHAIKMVNERENVAPISDWLQDARTKALLAHPEAP